MWLRQVGNHVVRVKDLSIVVRHPGELWMDFGDSRQGPGVVPAEAGTQSSSHGFRTYAGMTEHSAPQVALCIVRRKKHPTERTKDSHSMLDTDHTGLPSFLAASWWVGSMLRHLS